MNNQNDFNNMNNNSGTYINSANNPNNYNNSPNNDSYYGNPSGNYYSDSNYSDRGYNDREKKDNGPLVKIIIFIILLIIIILLLLKFCGGGKNKDDEYAALTERICNAAKQYAASNPNMVSSTPGTSSIIKFQTLAEANLIETQIKNPYYKVTLFKKSMVEKYYSMSNSARLTVMGDGSYACEIVENANDTTAPVLRLNGDEEIYLAVGTEYEDPGFSATDDFDGDVTSKVSISGMVDNSTAGEYVLTYTVADAAGNISTKTRKVIIQEYKDMDISLGTILDGVTPMIQLKGANPYCLVKGEKYVEPGATATDNVDGNLTDQIVVTNKVTGNLMGSFRIVYKVEDSSGNQAIAYRAVIVTTSCPTNTGEVSDLNNAPVITLVGKSAVTISKGSDYIDLGATAYDKEDGDISGKIITDASAVNVNVAGVYKVYYRVTDSAGKTTSKTRTVTVKENTTGTPSVRFTEDKENITVYVGQGSDSLIVEPKAVNENGVAVNVTKVIEDYVTKAVVGAIDWNTAGKYRVTYTAVHGNGSIRQNKNIVVTILESAVEIGGADSITIIKRSTNCDINEADLVAGGVTFKVNGTGTPIVTVTKNGNASACYVGDYTVTAQAKVNDGEATSKVINVKVIDGTPAPVDPTAPGKVNVVTNSANASDPYNRSGNWVGGTVTGINIGVEATAANGGNIAHFEYSTDCSTPTGTFSTNGTTTSVTGSMNAIGTLKWTTEGTNSVCIRAISSTGLAGNWSDPVLLKIDLTGPSVTFTHKWADGADDWHNSGSLTISYASSDVGAGLDHYEYTYDDVKALKAQDITTVSDVTGNVVVYENAEPARVKLFVYVRAIDKVGNIGEWVSNPAYANMDTVKPNTPTLTVTGSGTRLVQIKAQFTDGASIRQSGFGKLLYSIDDGEQKTSNSLEFNLPANSTKQNKTENLKVWAVDKAGNISDGYAEQTVVVAPTIEVTSVILKNGGTDIPNGGNCALNNTSILVGSSITLTATPDPTNANDTKVTWNTDNSAVASVDNGVVKAVGAGTTIITAKIGNVTTSCSLVVSSGTSNNGGGGGGSTPSSPSNPSSPSDPGTKAPTSVLSEQEFNRSTSMQDNYGTYSDYKAIAQGGSIRKGSYGGNMGKDYVEVLDANGKVVDTLWPGDSGFTKLYGQATTNVGNSQARSEAGIAGVDTSSMPSSSTVKDDKSVGNTTKLQVKVEHMTTTSDTDPTCNYNTCDWTKTTTTDPVTGKVTTRIEPTNKPGTSTGGTTTKS